MTWQPEDQHRTDMARILLGQQPLYRDKWRQRSVSVLPSANWEEQSSGLAVWDRYSPGIAYLTKRLADGKNNFLRGEFLADAAHYTFSLEGMMFQRKYARRDGLTQLAATVDTCILQWWSQIVLTADQMTNPGRAQFAWAHQRTVAPAGGTTSADYYWRRGCGQTHAGTGLANLGDRVGRDQDPFTLHLFADHFINDLKSDVGRILAAYRAGGYAPIARFIQRGSRGVWHWLRFGNGGYLSVQETDIGVDEPRYVCMRQAAGAPLRQFPEGTVTRQNRDGGAVLDMFAGTVKAFDSVYGKFSATFDPKSVFLWVTASPSGVVIEVGDGGSAAGVPGSSLVGEPTGNPASPESVEPPSPKFPRSGCLLSLLGIR